jgi:hypothetical protein
MSNPTTPFSWQMPQSTDLVTDLPADFEVFGQAVATSMADLLGGTTGQVLSKTTSADMDFTWINNDQGDITGVTAGTGISGGGTSGTVTVTNSMATAIDAKGDLIAGTGADAFSRLAVGANTYLLTADSAEATGLKWAAPAASASGLTLISSTSFTTSSGHSVNSCFSATYANYRIILKLSAVSGTNTEMLVRLRASGTDATTNYTTMRQLSYSAGVSTDLNPTGTDDWTMGLISTTSPTGLHTGSFEIFDPFAATATQGTSILNGYYGGSYYLLICENTNTNSTSYDGFTLIPGTGTITGTVRVYGYQNS